MNKNDEKKKLAEINEQIPQLFEKVINEATIDKIPELIKALAQIENETERDIYIEKIVEKFKVSKRAIQNDLKKIKKSGAKVEVNYKANFPGLIDLIIDEEDNIGYLIKDNELFIAREYENDGVLYSPPEKSDLPFTLPKGADIFDWYEGDDFQLFDDIMIYLKRFSYLLDKQWPIVTYYVFLTYLQDHPDIHYLPMLLFYAVPERGKSRTGKAITYIVYRGIHLVDLREANLFRFSQNLKATLFFDIMNLWKKAEMNGAEDILLLRNEKGAKATRVLYPEKGAFKDMKHFDIYGATLISTNEAIHKILDSRCISITMPNRPGDYENPTPDKAQELKGRLTAWRARVIDKPLSKINPIPELIGRLWDISKPLLQVCKLVNPQGYDELKDALIEVAERRLEDKKDSIEGQIVIALYEMSPEIENVFEWIVKTNGVLDLLNKNRPDAYKLSPQYLGKRFAAMGIKTRKVHGYSEVVLKKADFTTLLMQYGIIENNNSVPIPIETLQNSTTPLNQGISTLYTGRELVESEGNSTQTLPTESLDNQASKGTVESGRELQDTGKKKYLKTLEVVK